jgi:hypothetical protein
MAGLAGLVEARLVAPLAGLDVGNFFAAMGSFAMNKAPSHSLNLSGWKASQIA